MNIDKASSFEIAKIINNSDKGIALAIESKLEEISKVIDITYETIKNNGRIVYIGAGTSGRLGVLDASEMPPTYGVENNLFIGIIAGGDYALRNPVENAEDCEKSAINDLKEIKFCDKDLLIGIAASGRTPYVVAAIEYAKSINAKTASISTTKDSKIGEIVDYPIEVVVGPEVITGSTRMKSGTAQKLILNTISTGAMVKLGKVYENLMVDVKPTNEKLRERATLIVKTITNVDYKTAKEMLIKANYSAKLAIVMIQKDIELEQAKKLLKQANEKLGDIK